MRFDLSIVTALIFLGFTVYFVAIDELKAAEIAVIGAIFSLIVEVD